MYMPNVFVALGPYSCHFRLYTLILLFLQSPGIPFARSFGSFVHSLLSFQPKRKPKRKSVNVEYLPFSLQCCCFGSYLSMACVRTDAKERYLYIHIYIASVCVCMHRICVCGNMSVHKECEHICYSWVWVEFTIFRWNMSKTGRCAFKCVYVIIHLCMCMCLCTSMCICVFRFLFYPNVGLFFLSGTIERVRQN